MCQAIRLAPQSGQSTKGNTPRSQILLPWALPSDQENPTKQDQMLQPSIGYPSHRGHHNLFRSCPGVPCAHQQTPQPYLATNFEPTQGLHERNARSPTDNPSQQEVLSHQQRHIVVLAPISGNRSENKPTKHGDMLSLRGGSKWRARLPRSQREGWRARSPSGCEEEEAIGPMAV